MRARQKRFLWVVGLLAVFSIFAPRILQPQGPKKTQVRAYQLWRDDLRQIGRELPKRHKNAFFRISEKAWHTLVEASIKRLGPKVDLPHFIAELLRICAAIGDSHTQLAWQQARLPQAPVRFFAFSDGVFVTIFPKDHAKLKGAEVLSLQGVPIAKVLKRLRTFIPAENESFLAGQVAGFLPIPSLLQAFGIGDDPKVLKIGIREGKKELEIAIPALRVGQRPRSPFATSFTKIPAFLGRVTQNYSYTFLQKGRTLYLRYNHCRDFQGFKRLVTALMKEVAAKKPNKFILDLRSNGGGNSEVIAPLFNQLHQNPILKKANLLCLIGRRTFSSALLNAIQMKQRFHATLVGEPTGGKPNHYGEIKQLLLKNSHLTLFYSTKLFKTVPNDPDSLVPDKLIPLKSQDVFQNRDLALQYCLGVSQNH